MFDHLEIDPVLFWPSVAGAVGLVVGIPIGKDLLGRRARRLLERQAHESAAYLKAMKFAIAGDTDKTIETLLGVVRANTEGVEPYLALGRLFRERGDAARSLRLHQHLLVRPGIPDDARKRSLFALGRDLRALGEPERARRALERAMRVLKKDAAVVRELAEVCEGLRDWEVAIALRKREGKLRDQPSRPIRSHLYAAWGAEVAEKGEQKRALRLLRKAVHFSPAALHPRVLFADLLFKRGDRRGAAENYQQALLTSSPLRGSVIAKLEETYFQLGDFGRLETFLRGALAQAQGDSVLRFALARFLMRKGQHDEAIATLRALLTERPDLREAHRDLGTWFLATGESAAIRDGYGALLQSLDRTLAGYDCAACGRVARDVEWRCARCGAWESQRPKAIVERAVALPRAAVAV